MALYSWFSRTDKNPTVKSTNINNNNLLKTSDTIKYIETNTMWPTAKIKPNIEITTPNYGDKIVKPPKVVFPTKTTLTAIKS